MSFIYYNVSALRLANKPIQVEKEALNPNLAKLFLRHYEQFAKQHKLKIESDDEDYMIPVSKHRKSEDITLDNLTPNIKSQPMRPPPSRHKKANPAEDVPKTNGAIGAHVGKKTDIFMGDDKAKALKDSDLKNKFEFPTLGETPQQAALKPTSSSNWGRGDLYLYEKRGALTKKEQEELFPSLGNEPPKAEKLAPKPVIKPPPKPDFGVEEKAPTGGFNWLEESKRQAMENALNHGNVEILKAKKRKKK